MSKDDKIDFDEIEANAIASTALDMMIDGKWLDLYRTVEPEKMVNGKWVMYDVDADWVLGRPIASRAVVTLACFAMCRVGSVMTDYKINAIIDESYRKIMDLAEWLIDTHAGDENISIDDPKEIDKVLKRFYPEGSIISNTETLLHVLMLFNKYIETDIELLKNMNMTIKGKA